jgi:hypothetical protein
MNIEDIKDFIRNRALRYAGSCSSQGSMEFNILNELYFDLFGEPAVNTIPKYDNLAIEVHHIENGHEYVDLGLPSGTLWATCNVGATKPEEYGDYFAWGEKMKKDDYGWGNYKYGADEYNGNYSKLTKYNQSDSKTTLDISDDAAYVNWGDKWRMPTYEQQKEICNECYWVWTENYKGSDRRGYIVYKAKGAIDKGRKIYKNEILSSSYTLYDTHIFLPAAGWRYNGGLYNEGLCGHYWSLLQDCHNDPIYAWNVFFDSYNVLTQDDCRYVGFTIRPVLNQKY